MITYQSVHVDSDSETLTAKLHEFHDAILRDHTHIIRVACALYEEKTDYLKTFIHSTRDGHAITAYQAKLSEVPSLNALAEHQECRVIDNVQFEIKPGTEHSDWLLDQGYVSSFTVPIIWGTIWWTRGASAYSPKCLKAGSKRRSRSTTPASSSGRSNAPRS